MYTRYVRVSVIVGSSCIHEGPVLRPRPLRGMGRGGAGKWGASAQRWVVIGFLFCFLVFIRAVFTLVLSLGLGTLPPAASITSIAQHQAYPLVMQSSSVVGGPFPEIVSVAPTIPSIIPHMMTDPSLPLPQLQPGVPAFSFGQSPPASSYTARLGMILSPASDPIPANLVQ